MGKYFFSDGDFIKGYVALRNDTAHHLIHALRVKKGELVTLCDGKGTDWKGVLRETDVKRGICRFDVSDPTPCQTEPAVPVTLYQSLPKGDKMELIIQKCVELGVCGIVPIYTAHSLVRDAGKRTARYQRVVESAAEQSMRGIIPRVSPPLTFAQAVATRDICAKTFVALSPGEIKNIDPVKPEVNPISLFGVFRNPLPERINLWIGPEGGFSSEEINALLTAGAVPISLGRRVLRTETAAFTALAQINLLTECAGYDLPR
ncbi:MAG: 16S rRNA (uracil(1498)-N(3))-methyltransferase [Defluviitaleaceae bacterium]|nr:16S rRNA (uracil(1498)-N(3))-methyltransferase [Defluviitaleaceae bacterium]